MSEENEMTLYRLERYGKASSSVRPSTGRYMPVDLVWDRALSAARVAIARLELVSAGTTSSPNSEGGGHPGSKAPPPADAEWRDLRERLRVAHSVEELDRIRVAADEAWKASTGRGTADRDRGEGVTDAQLVLEAVGHDAEAVAWRFSWDVRRVRRHRGRNGQDPETGRPAEVVSKEVKAMDFARRREEVQRRRDKNQSTHQIADAMGIDQKQVMRYLRRAS